jgi:hypothetical protein
MLMHSDRRATLQSAKIGPPAGFAQEASRSGVALLVRTTSPTYATLLAEKLPAPISARKAIDITLLRSRRMSRSAYSSGARRMSATLAAFGAARQPPGRGAFRSSIGANMEKGI